MVTSGAPATPASSVGWRPVGRAAAETDAGFVLLTVPDLPLLGIEVYATDRAVRVVQALGPRDVLTLIERIGEASPQDGMAPGGMRSVSARVDGITVTAVAPLSADSLRALLDRLR